MIMARMIAAIARSTCKIVVIELQKMIVHVILYVVCGIQRIVGTVER